MKTLLMLLGLSLVLCICAQKVQADPVVFTATLTGPAEQPPNMSPGVGFAIVTFDPTAHTLRVQVIFGNLLAPVTVAHIHAPTAVAFAGTAGVATAVPTFPGFPTMTFGVYDMTFNTLMAATYNPAFVTMQGGTLESAEAALFSFMLEGRSYFNIHSSAFPGGEIRGFLQPIPEPATLFMLGAGIGGLAFKLKRRRSINPKS